MTPNKQDEGVQPRHRWAPHETALVVVGFVLPLAGQTRPEFLGYDSVKAGAVVVAAFFLACCLLGAHTGTVLPPAVRRALLPLALYAATLTLASVTWSLPWIRYQALALFLVAAAAFPLCEALRPGSFADVTYRASTAHLVLAVSADQTQLLASGVERYAGATSAVFTGFESVLVFIVAWSRWRRRAGRWPLVSLAAAGLATYTVYGSFSRAAIVSFGLAIIVLLVYRGRRFRTIKIALMTGLTVGAYYLTSDVAVRVLGGNDPESFTGASGRYEIWQRVLSAADQWWRGYGFAALKYADGPDWELFVATGGRPSENALLQAILMGGIVAGVLWLWLAARAARTLWSAREATAGASVALAVTLAINAAYSVGLSGSSSAYWWLLAAFSVAAGTGRYTGASIPPSSAQPAPGKTARSDLQPAQ